LKYNTQFLSGDIELIPELDSFHPGKGVALEGYTKVGVEDICICVCVKVDFTKLREELACFTEFIVGRPSLGCETEWLGFSEVKTQLVKKYKHKIMSTKKRRFSF
jgi:hypothetical protein